MVQDTDPQDPSPDPPTPRRRRWPIALFRYVLPVVVAIAGIVIMLHGGESDTEGGAGIVSAGLAIYWFNWLARAAVSGNRVRDQEGAARAYYDRHGHWPGEGP